MLRLSIISGWIAVAGTIGASVFAVDGRYVHLTDYEVQQQQVVASVKNLRKQTLEDKVFELNAIPVDKRTDAQRAMLERHKAQLEEASNESRR